MSDIVEEARRHIERDHLRDEVLAEIQMLMQTEHRMADMESTVVAVRKALERLS